MNPAALTLRQPEVVSPRRSADTGPQLVRHPPLAAARRTLRPARPRTPVVVAIIALHAALLLGLASLHHHHARARPPEPIQLSLVAAPPRHEAPPPAPLPPPHLENPPPPVVVPVPAITLETVPTAVITTATVPTAVITTAPAPAPVVQAPPQPMPAPTVAHPVESPATPRTIPASAVQYLVPPAPVYSRLSARLKESGRAVVRVFVDEQGIARDVQLATSSGFQRLDDSAVTAVRNARFKPFTENGRPVSGWVFIPIEFELQS